MSARFTRLLWGAVLLLVLHVPRAGAEIAQVTVAVDGLGCPFCVYGIEKKLAAVEGVRDVTIDLETGLAAVHLSDGAIPNLGALRTAVEKAGFTPRQVTLTAIGTLAIEDKEIHLAVRGSDDAFLLFEEGKDHKGFFDDETRRRLTQLAADGIVVAVTGAAHDHGDGPPGLATTEVKPLQTVRLRVAGMNCENCAARLTRLLQDTEGVYRAAVSFTTSQATVESLGRALDPSALIAVVEEAGFTAALEPGANGR